MSDYGGPEWDNQAPLRLRLRRLRWRLRRLRRWRLAAGAVVAGLSVILSTVYDNIPTHWQRAALGVLTVSGAATVLLAEPPEARVVDPLSRPAGKNGTGQRRKARGNLHPLGPRPVLRWARLWRSQAVPTLPPGDALFRGRRRELACLTGLHNEQRALRAERPVPSWHVWRASSWGRLAARFRRRPGTPAVTGPRATGPVILLVHGMPGVGKSALVDQLARGLAGQYPHGQMYVSLGVGSAARSPKEVLQELLIGLGWPEREMPETAVERARLFRSLTAKKRILFIFDAARHAEQVEQIMPSDSAAAVLITSRRDLMWPDPLPAPSYHLGLPDQDDAMAIFRAVSRTRPGTAPECATEILTFCGRLPLAIRAAAERVSDDGAGVCQIAGLLREERSRLGWLDRPGRSIRGHLATEYGRLLPQEQRAFALLSLVPSATFVPWVLAPMMGLESFEAEALVDRLATAQLVYDLHEDQTERAGRYEFHPLTRLFALERAEALPAGAKDEALGELDRAYLSAVSAALAVLDDNFPAPQGPSGREAELAKRIAQDPEQWARFEYLNLLHLIDSPGTDDRLRWRLGVWLKGCVVAGASPRATLKAYEAAIGAAEREGDLPGRIDVLLSQGTFLIAIERYRHAEDCLDRAAVLADALGARGGAMRKPAASYAVTVARKRGEALLQAARYQEAIVALDKAYRRAESIADDGEQRLIRILLAEAHHVDRPETAKDELIDPSRSDATRYRVLLSLAEAARRRGDWDSADEYLTMTLEHVDGDLRREASVRYRMARLLLDRAGPAAGLPRGTDEDPAVLATTRAATAALMFQAMDNPLGVVRAYCLLARAVLAMDRSVGADHLVHVARDRLDGLYAAGDCAQALPPLRARLDRVRGEIHLRAGDYEGGRQLVMRAAAAFGQQGDWAAQRDVLRLLRGNPSAGARQAPGDGTGQFAADDPARRGGIVVSSALLDGAVSLSAATTEGLATRLSSSVAGRVQDEIRQAFAPEPTVAFRGALGMHLAGAVPVEGAEQPTWRVPVGTRCGLTVVIATGYPPFAHDDQRPVLAEPRQWLPAAVTRGIRADNVELTLTVDAPFIEVTQPELTTACPVEGGEARHHSDLIVPEPGRHELRIVLLSSGRMVQTLPIQLEAVDGG